MNRVFVVQQPMKRDSRGGWHKIMDLSPAEKFGRFIFVTGHPGNIFTNTLPTIINHMRAVLKDFDDGDFILPTGEPVAIAAVAMIAAQANGGRVKFLKWNGLDRSYEPVTVNIGKK